MEARRFILKLVTVLALLPMAASATGSETTGLIPREGLAHAVERPSAEKILPDPLDRTVAPRVAQAVCAAWTG